MIIGIANDHNGVNLKNEIVTLLTQSGYKVKNYGTDTEESVDYPLYAFKIGEAINKKEIETQEELAEELKKSGFEVTQANKVKNIRCAKVENEEEAFLTRSHNDSNILALNDSKSIEEVKKIIMKFIETPFSNEERHQRRINMINNYNNEY